MTQLEGCIQHWEAVLSQSGYLLSPSTQVIIRETIKFLKELQEVKGDKGIV